MSVRSVNTAVIWAKPLRENERVDSRPGVPARAVSIGNVTCFSISIGESDGATALTWTWTLVTSGTASIGSLVRDQAPEIVAASVKSKTSQRRWTENARMRSIISVFGRALHELGLERKRVGRGNDLARLKAFCDLREAIIGAAGDNRALLESIGRADKHDFFTANRLDGGGGYHQRYVLLLHCDRGCDERSGP